MRWRMTFQFREKAKDGARYRQGLNSRAHGGAWSCGFCVCLAGTRISRGRLIDAASFVLCFTLLSLPTPKASRDECFSRPSQGPGGGAGDRPLQLWGGSWLRTWKAVTVGGELAEHEQYNVWPDNVFPVISTLPYGVPG